MGEENERRIEQGKERIRRVEGGKRESHSMTTPPPPLSLPQAGRKTPRRSFFSMQLFLTSALPALWVLQELDAAGMRNVVKLYHRPRGIKRVRSEFTELGRCPPLQLCTSGLLSDCDEEQYKDTSLNPFTYVPGPFKVATQ